MSDARGNPSDMQVHDDADAATYRNRWVVAKFGGAVPRHDQQRLLTSHIAKRHETPGHRSSYAVKLQVCNFQNMHADKACL